MRLGDELIMTRNARLCNLFTSLFSASANCLPPTWNGSHRSPIARRCFSCSSPSSQERGLKVSTIEDSRSTTELQNSDDGDDKNVAFNQTLSLVKRGSLGLEEGQDQPIMETGTATSV